MRTPNTLLEPRSDDLDWHLLGEYSLRIYLSDDDEECELTTALLFQTTREWDILPEYLEIIYLTLNGFAKEALVYLKQGGLELPDRIRVFCHKKILNEANSVKTTRLVHAEQIIERAILKHHSCTIMNAGWGYFIIDRPPDGVVSSGKTRPFVDLYLYKEGE